MPDRLLSALSAGVEVHDLGRPLFAGMPQSPNHPEFRHALVRRHGDMMRGDGGSAANDLVVMGTHVGTHIDALCHVSQDGALYGGHDAGAAQIGGGFTALGAETINPIVCRGILADIPAVLGLDACPPAYEVTAADLEAALDRADVTPERGDVILVRTGWAQQWSDRDAYIGQESGVPGPGEEAAKWLASHMPRAVGADTIAFEHLAAGAGHSRLPAHRVLLVEHGIYIIETLDLEGLARAGATEFAFVLAPLKLVGATGSPARPIALVSRGS